MVPNQKLKFLRLIFGIFQPKGNSRAKKRLRTFSKWSAKIQEKNTISQWEKRVGKESKSLGSVWRRFWETWSVWVLCRAQERGPRALCGQCFSWASSGIFIFPREIGVTSDYRTLRISLNLGSVSFLLLKELQGLQMGWNEAGMSKERRDLGEECDKKKTKQEQIRTERDESKGIGICLELGKYPGIPN